MSGDGAHHGLQRERTSLAWNRTALAMIVAGGLHVRAGGGRLLPQLPGLLLVALGAWLLLRSPGRDRRPHRAEFAPAPRLYLAVAVATGAFSVAAALTIALGG